LSNVNEDEVRRSQRLTPVVSIQNRYSVDDRDSESLIDLCEQEQMVFVPYAPIRDVSENGALMDLAERYHATPRQIVLAWLLARSPSMLPIPGTGSVTHVVENVSAAAIHLSEADVETLTANA
jgi:aryl-alcohol dehydrogenase-like predicted oxidoreductase